MKTLNIKDNLLVTKRPDLAEEWNIRKNKNLELSEMTVGSNKKVWWIDSFGHEWQDTISHRTSSGRGCPYCSGRKVLTGFNDFASAHPELLPEWDKKNDCRPTDLTKSSTQKVKWICPKGHHYVMSPRDRSNGHGCPVCAGRQIDIGFNDLRTLRPDLVAEWDYTKNSCKPEGVTIGSHKKIYWICPRGHSYMSQVKNRVYGFGCPICDKERKTSMPEQIILFYLSKSFNVENRKKLNGFEADIYIDTLKTAIEYDGIAYHSSEKAQRKEILKNEAFKELKIRLIRVKEIGPKKTSYVSGDTIYYSYSTTNYKNIKWVIEEIFNLLGKTINFEIDIEKDRISIGDNYFSIEKANSIISKYPYLKDEWDYEMNGKIKPEFISYSSNQEFYWKCNAGKGHPSYKATPSHKIRGNGCPYCSGHRVFPGDNDLATTNPELIEEWDFDKNTIKPTEISKGSEIVVWWKCKQCGKHYRMMIYSRSKGSGCIECKKKATKLKCSKKVLNLDTGISFESLHDAATSIGPRATVTPISNCCKGLRRSAYGYRWKFIE